MPSEKPILFSGPMVRAILDGRKTQTRRVIKWPDLPSVKEPCDDNYVIDYGDGPWPYQKRSRANGCVDEIPLACPYGAAGDRLWVKETWRPAFHHDEYCTVQYAADSAYRKPDFSDENRGLRFSDLCDQCGGNAEPWHPSIHMWREFSRITLKVLSVRVEYVQNITEADAIAEGVQTERDYYGGDTPLKVYGSIAWHRYDGEPCSAVSARHAFHTLWDSIHGKDSWDSWSNNRHVWVVEFRRSDA